MKSADRTDLQPNHGDEAGTARVSVLMGVPAVLRAFGLDPGEALAAIGLDASTFDDAENRISFEAGGALLNHCVQVTGCAHFGLLVGQHVNLPALGTVGLTAQTSDTVGAALQTLTAHLHTQTRGGVPTFAIEADFAAFGYALYVRHVPGITQIYDLVVAFEFNILNSLCGPTWKATRISFAHTAPADIAAFRKFFGRPLVFDADRTVIYFKKKWLDLPPEGANAARHQVLERELFDQEQKMPERFAHHVRRAVRTMVSQGNASEERLSHLFKLSSRTIHRRLAAVNTPFRTILDDVRYEVSRQLLTDTQMTTAEVANSLTYVDASAFNRAFRRWTGTSPGSWRDAVRQGYGPAGSEAEGAAASIKASRTVGDCLP